MGKNQTIYGLHSVKAALINDRRRNEELIISENLREFSIKYQNKVKKIRILKPHEFKKKIWK